MATIPMALVAAELAPIPEEGEGAWLAARYEANADRMIERMAEGATGGPFVPDWESLGGHLEAPDWFLDGKIGIYFHWGIYSVPAYGNEWYAKWMHVADPEHTRHHFHRHHRATYGPPEEFGYHDFIPRFTAEHFDAEEWADLFVSAGARWAGPVCEHHDGFAMWDSRLTPWNAARMGPRRDITGELAAAIRKRNLKLVTTFHHERTLTWYPRVEGWPTTSEDPLLRLLYMNVGERRFHRLFQAKLGEVIDRYEPDMIWFDSRMHEIPEPYHLQFLAYYFNRAASSGREVMVTTKKRQYPREVSVLDYEKGRAKSLTPYPWLNDDTIAKGSWCYTQGLKVKPARRVIHDFIDAISKNGHLLLNISPRADGTIPEDQRACLRAIGRWLRVNGEAVYGTRPWLEFGEGPTRLKRAGSFGAAVDYTAEDVRYTRSKDGSILHAFVLGWPPDGKFSPRVLRVKPSAAAEVRLLGHEVPLDFEVTGGRLEIDLPARRPCEHAWVFRLEGFETSAVGEEVDGAPQEDRD